MSGTSERAETVVFLGPSLPLEEARQIVPSGVDWRPPVRRGDLPKAVAEGARRLAIVDGEFGQSLAVSVLEIRAALATGAAVWGASSMGALRGAECQGLGMRGFGWIFRGYAEGRLAADDEVALLFNPWSGEAVTVPLVNFRWSLERAVEERALGAAWIPELIAAARRVRFAERTLDSLRQAGRGRPWESAMGAVVGWMEGNPDRADRKRLDALELLGALAVELAAADLLGKAA